MKIKNNLANYLTTSRIILTPILCLLLIKKISFILSFFLFVFIFATDWLDGFLARKIKVSNFGKILDPVADKILVFSTLTCLIYSKLIDIWAFILLLFRDLLMSSVRILLAKENIIYSANIFGKLKTMTQFFSLLFLINALYLDSSAYNYMVSYKLGILLIWISVFLSFVSFFMCMFENKDKIKKLILE